MIFEKNLQENEKSVESQSQRFFSVYFLYEPHVFLFILQNGTNVSTESQRKGKMSFDKTFLSRFLKCLLFKL